MYQERNDSLYGRRVLDLDLVGRWRVCAAVEDEITHVLDVCQCYEYQTKQGC